MLLLIAHSTQLGDVKRDREREWESGVKCRQHSLYVHFCNKRQFNYTFAVFYVLIFMLSFLLLGGWLVVIVSATLQRRKSSECERELIWCTIHITYINYTYNFRMLCNFKLILRICSSCQYKNCTLFYVPSKLNTILCIAFVCSWLTDFDLIHYFYFLGPFRSAR